MTTGIVLKILQHSLSIADSKEQRKYLDKIIHLRNKWDEEMRQNEISDYHLELIDSELLNLFESAATNLAGKN